ncbi:MAG: hypothetical protein BGP24_19600 [Lysobacterales bacterium 69-70]|nr:MAG: hypothetical protein ABS97_10360 [Xanthomonadaceae bacterium SCN 69-320]ODV18728.1 MAG: hypothetical protein ABT27_13070 [Xanthomonadaceae bacterium SCN 69-25]OJY93069.1 MAG: hypothetical protein BGP24_19600 [Xanthomonadales bacterium 69-70]
MRQIYTSLRQENIDRVVALMSEHDIQTTVTNRSSYKGGDWKRFSYSNRPDASTWPQVWVVNANDQTRARELLREAGIEPPVRYAEELAASREPLTGQARHRAVAGRMRLVTLALVAVAALLLSLRTCSSGSDEPGPPQKRQVVPVTTH